MASQIIDARAGIEGKIEISFYCIDGDWSIVLTRRARTKTRTAVKCPECVLKVHMRAFEIKVQVVAEAGAQSRAIRA